MATTVEGAIEEALLGRLASLVLSPVHPISWPNNNFTKPSGNRYLEARFVPNQTNRLLIGSTEPHQRTGFLQVNVRDALSVGPRVTDVAGLVAAHFPADLRLTHATGITIRITTTANVGPMLVEDNPPGVLVPVLIPWSCWA